MATIFISDATAYGTHGATIRTAFLDNCSTLTASDVTLELNANADLASIIEDMGIAFNAGYEVFICSLNISIPTLTALAQTYYDSAQTMLVFFPLGSNSYEELATPTSIPVVVNSGAGISTAGSNQTGYGAGLEFWDRETYGTAGTAESSYSNGVIAGKLYSIKVGRNCSWWEARYCARKTASQGGIWNKYNGYGLINVSDAIAFSGTIPLDPYDETIVSGMERLSDNFKFWGQTDVTFADLTKSFAYYEAIARL